MTEIIKKHRSRIMIHSRRDPLILPPRLQTAVAPQLEVCNPPCSEAPISQNNKNVIKLNYINVKNS
jgi:hypothetical protein